MTTIDKLNCMCESKVFAFRRQDLIDAKNELESLTARVAVDKEHMAQSDKELCQLQDALGFPCESRSYYCNCGWRGYNTNECPKCRKETHDIGIADAQKLCMERIRDLIAKEGECGDLSARVAELEAAAASFDRLQLLDVHAICEQRDAAVKRADELEARVRELETDQEKKLMCLVAPRDRIITELAAVNALRGSMIFSLIKELERVNTVEDGMPIVSHNLIYNARNLLASQQK